MRGLLVLLLALLAAGEARACPRALIHDGLPMDFDSRLVVALVDIEWTIPATLYERGATARVRRIVQGRYDGDLLILRPEESSCSAPFRNGRSGLVVGIPIGMEDGVLVLDAFEISAGSGYRMPERYRVPEAYFETLRRKPSGQ